jgi:hypothetical protein
VRQAQDAVRQAQDADPSGPVNWFFREHTGVLLDHLFAAKGKPTADQV